MTPWSFTMHILIWDLILIHRKLFICSITYPAISAFVSMQTDADKQGLVQGMINGMRGLCNGLGPAMYGLIFSLFHVDLNEQNDVDDNMTQKAMPDLFSTSSGSHKAPPPLNVHNNSSYQASLGDHVDSNYQNIDFASITTLVPGPPFVFGAFLVMLALMVAAFIPDPDDRIRYDDSKYKSSNIRRHPSIKSPSAVHLRGKKKSDDSDSDDQDDLLDQIKHHRELPSEKDDSMEDEDYDYMTTVPLMEGVKDRSLL